MLWWKLAKFLMLFSKPQLSFSSNFASLSSVMKDNFFRSKITRKDFLRLLSARIKIHQIFVIFETKNQFFFKCFYQYLVPSNKKSFLHDLSFWSVYLDFLTMISLFGLSFLLFVLKLSTGTNSTNLVNL